MKKFFKFIIKNRIYIIGLFFAVLLILCALALKAYLYPEDENTNYGTRLDGIEEVLIDTEKKDKVIALIKENDKVTDASIRVQGKIINISVVVTSIEQTTDVMQESLNKVLELFDEDEMAFYDFQFFVKNEDANYNMLGSKSKKSEVIVWSFDVIVSEEEVNEEE